MSRSERLLKLLDILRRHRYPVAGNKLAQDLNISLRTLYRDIATLQAQGALIEGEAGLGYVLNAGFYLPPLMFSIEEIEALTLGLNWVSERTDATLSIAAQNALGKINAVLPNELQHTRYHSTFLLGPSQLCENNAWLNDIRQAIHHEVKIEITYSDVEEQKSQRIVWPFGIAVFDKVYVVLAYCELRQDFRHFRIDRIKTITILADKMPKQTTKLMKEWKAQLKKSLQCSFGVKSLKSHNLES